MSAASTGELVIPEVDTAGLSASITNSSAISVAIEAGTKNAVATFTAVKSEATTVSGVLPKILSDSLVAPTISSIAHNPLIAHTVSQLAPSLKKIQQVTSALNSVASIHPVVGIVVSALTALFQLELQRRQNNVRAVALIDQIAATVVVLQQLQKVTDEAGLKTVLISIADHIRSTEAFITLYTTKGTMLRILKCGAYSDKMKAIATTFSDDKRLLCETLQRCAVIGIDAANDKLDAQDRKLDDILAILSKRSAEEIVATKFAARHEVSLEDLPASDNLLRRLAFEVKDSTTNMVELRQELSISLDELLEKHSGEFRLAFDAQSKQMSEGFDKILTAVESGPWLAVEHPDMQQLWKQERWKGSVPRGVFMEALAGFYEDFYARYPTAAGAICASWIKSQHWASMAECVDTDESGYIGIKELNLFTAATPSEWTLPSWFAYVGVGDKLRMTFDSQTSVRLVDKLEEIAKAGGPNSGPLTRFLEKTSSNISAIDQLWCWALEGDAFPLPEDTDSGSESSDDDATDYSDSLNEGSTAGADDEDDEVCLNDRILGERILAFMAARDAKIKAWLAKHDWKMTTMQYEDLRDNEPVDTPNGSLSATVKIVLQHLYDELTARPDVAIPPRHFLALRQTLKTIFYQYSSRAEDLYEQ
ncbi:hypothetical protein HKX48_007520, partial [Thoreauomyces humboldtii]